MIISAAARERILINIQERADNSPWLARCLEGDATAFPHHPYREGSATIGRHLIVPRPPLDTQPMACDNDKPRYVINIPFRHYPGENDVAPFTRLLNLFLNEAYGTIPAESRAELMQRIVVIIGMNQIESIDPAMNRSFEAFIAALPRIEGVVYRVFGFYWKPEWVKCSQIIQKTCRGIDLAELVRVNNKPASTRTLSENKLFKKYAKCQAKLCDRVRYHFGETWNVNMIGQSRLFGSIYPVARAIKLLNFFSYPKHDYVSLVREALEGSATGLHRDIVGQVPYQEIREVILRSQMTRLAVMGFQQSSPQSPEYLVLMDHDLLAFKQGGVGLFTRYDTCIEEKGVRSSACLGYSIESDKPPLLRAGIRIDMKVREALGYLAYPPEPCSCLLIRRPYTAHHLDRLSFLGAGDALESRRLYQSGLDAGVLQRDGIFSYDGGVTMETPARMLNANNRSVDVLTPAILKKQKSLQAIRGVRQSHAVPLKWAENVYARLDYSCKRASDARGPLSHIFALFDPLSRMRATPGVLTPAIFNRIMTDYYKPLTGPQSELLEEAKATLRNLEVSKDMRSKVQRELAYEVDADDFEAKIATRIAQKTEAMIAEVEAAARVSGEAIYQELHTLTS